MNKILKKNPILHAVLWIIIYITLVNIGDALAEQTNSAQLPTSILLIVLSIAMIMYIKRSDNFEGQDIRKVTKYDMKRTLFYLPLILLAFIQFSEGINGSLSISEITVSCFLMIGTGFVEELIFRGFLFQGIFEKSGVNRAILISGITFGIGHIVNLFRGYGLAELAGQIIVAIVVGIVLALLVAVTKNLLPGILFHIIFNISGIITNNDSGMQNYLLILIFIIAVLYAIYLFRFVHEQREAKKSQRNK